MSRSLQMSMFTGLRQASSIYYPAHSKNGVNVSQRLVVNAYMNIASKANDGKGRNEAISLTCWGKGADILALCLTPGKEFNAICDLHVYQGRVFHNDQPLQATDGTPITTKKYSYTIRQFDLGNDSFKHIMNEIQLQIRGEHWWMQGTQDYENFRALLKARMTVQFDPSLGTFGFAEVRKPEGANISAYIPNAPVNTTAMPAATIGMAPNPAAVAAAFGAPVRPATPVQTLAKPINAAASFVPRGV
jgi:hypothetical protein